MGYVCLCISSFLFDPKGPSQAGRGPRRHHPDCAGVDDSGVVPTSFATAGRRTSTSSQRSGGAEINTLRDAASASQNFTADGSKHLRAAVEAKGIHGKACNIICASWRLLTQKQYHIIPNHMFRITSNLDYSSRAFILWRMTMVSASSLKLRMT